MHIVIIDGYTLNPGDLSWKNLEKYGELIYFDRTEPNVDEYIERCKNAEVIIINKAGLVIGEEILSQLSHLKLILVSATGYNIIDIAACKKLKIKVANVPGYGTDSVAQHTIALLLELSNRVGVNSKSVENGNWVTATDWCYIEKPIVELAGKTLGIIGFGNIGQKVAHIAHALGMKILYFSKSDKNSALGQYTSLETLIKNADFITLHCPANDQTTKMVNDGFLKKMKSTAYLINTSRGQLIDEQALANSLNSHQIAGAALDVLSQEPPQAENPLLSAENCLITPHNGWISLEARQRIMIVLEENLKAFLSGNPINLVN